MFVTRQDEHPLALVGGADFRRAEYSPRHLVTHFFQVADDCGESQRDVPLDVLEEAASWVAGSDPVGDPWPEVSGVVLSLSLSCGGKWLAREPAREDVHKSVKLSEFKRLKIRPDRSRVHESRFHFCDQVRADESFDLTVSDRAQASDSSLESDVNSAVSSAQADMICLGSIHIAFSYLFRNMSKKYHLLWWSMFSDEFMCVR